MSESGVACLSGGGARLLAEGDVGLCGGGGGGVLAEGDVRLVVEVGGILVLARDGGVFERCGAVYIEYEYRLCYLRLVTRVVCALWFGARTAVVAVHFVPWPMERLAWGTWIGVCSVQWCEAFQRPRRSSNCQGAAL